MMNTSLNRDWSKLKEPFKAKLTAVFADLAGHGLQLFLQEGFRTVARQKWLYAQGRTRRGPVITFKNGVESKSFHQSGFAADVIFANEDGSHYWPPLRMPNGKLAPEWALLASSAKSHRLTWGGSWKTVDSPHLEYRSV